MTIRRISDLQLGSIATTKLLTVSSAETLFTISSGNRAFEASNIGSQTIYYGASGVLFTSGGFITATNSKFWDTITDNFQMYFVVASGGVTSRLVIQEYAGQ